MPTLDWQVAATGETTLVELFVTSDTETRVEISSNLEPVWPPRRQSRPAAGWDGSGFEGVVSAGEPLVLGYASPDDPVEPPATIVDTEPVTGSSEGAPSPEALVRELGEAGPPRDAVPTHGSPSTDRGPGADPHSPGDGPTTAAQHSVDRGSVADDRQPSAHASGTDPPGADQPHDTGRSQDENDRRSAVSSGTEQAQTPGGGADTRSAGSTDYGPSQRTQQSGHAGSRSSTGRTRPRERAETARADGSTAGTGTAASSGGTDTVEPGEAIDAWLDALGGRIETAERLAAVETAGEARAAVDAAGGMEAVRALCERLDADRRRLERIEQRYSGFGDRLDEIEVPLSALERLA